MCLLSTILTITFPRTPVIVGFNKSKIYTGIQTKTFLKPTLLATSIRCWAISSERTQMATIGLSILNQTSNLSRVFNNNHNNNKCQPLSFNALRQASHNIREDGRFMGHIKPVNIVATLRTTLCYNESSSTTFHKSCACLKHYPYLEVVKKSLLG